jgi:hypothetical protein
MLNIKEYSGQVRCGSTRVVAPTGMTKLINLLAGLINKGAYEMSERATMEIAIKIFSRMGCVFISESDRA